VLVLLLCSLVWPHPTVGQSNLSVSILNVDDGAFPDVTAVVAADRGGLPMTGAELGDWQIEEGGRPALLTASRLAVDSSVPLAVVLTIDVSGSMEELGTLDKTKDAAIALVNGLSPDDRAAVIAFDDQVRLEQPFTGDKAALRAAISRLRPNGSTALHDAIAESARLAGSSGLSRRAVVLLSDGKESGNASRLSRQESLDIAAQAATLMYVIGVGTDVDAEYLQAVAARSRGRFYPAFGPAAIPEVYSLLEQVLASHYVLTFRSFAPSEPRQRSLRVQLTRGPLAGDATREYDSVRPAGPSPVPPSWPLLGAVAALAAGLLVAHVRRGGKQRREAILVAPDEAPLVPAREPRPDASDGRPAEGPAGRLVLIGGPMEFPPLAGEFEIGRQPATIGSSAHCEVVLPAAPGLAAEHARAWLRDGRIMVHHLAAGYQTAVAGQSVEWASLAAGDQCAVGPYVFRFVRSRNGADRHAV
jgi:VWFA-related protein